MPRILWEKAHTFTIQKGQNLQALLGLRSVISSCILNSPKIIVHGT